MLWFGGKRKVAPQVWAALGDVDSYAETFAGSLAVLLDRPTWHSGATETVNDADQYLANFWRALSHDPEQVAHHADCTTLARNYDFRDEVSNGRLIFDYQLREGPCPTTNALKIMEMEGLPVGARTEG